MAHPVRSVVCVWVAGMLVGEGCHGPAARVPARPAKPGAPIGLAVARASSTRPQVTIDATTEDGALAIRLPDTKPTSADAVVSALSASETDALLARLEPLPDVAPASAATPPIRPPSAPPPRPGNVQPIAFVAARGTAVGDAPVAPAAAAKPLDAPQILPQGEVRADSEIRVRFAEPMVPVAQVGSPAKPPIKIAPDVVGTWRWIDTRVVVFTAKGARLPQATAYTVTVAGGMRAVGGALLPADVESKFSTAPLGITGTYPTGTIRPDAPLVVRFDQDFDPAVVVPMLRVEKRGKPIAHRTISLADALPLWRKHPALDRDPTDRELGEHYVVLAPATTWPAGMEGRVALNKGAPSREGPRVSERESDIEFSVAQPFTVRGLSCDEFGRQMTGARCPAQTWVRVELSNPIAPASFHAADIQIEGEPFEDHEATGDTVGVLAPSAVGRTYAIAIGGDLHDTFGQPLVGPRRPTFTTGPYRYQPELSAPSGLHVLDPRFEIPQWVITGQAVSSVHVQLYQVQPKDYFAYTAFERGARGVPPGRRVLDKQHAVGAKYGATLRTDLRPALGAGGVGHVIAVATAAPAPGAREHREPMRQVAWIEVSKLGVTARTDGDRVNAWVTDIAPAHFLEPKPGASATITVDGRSPSPAATTDADGHVVFDLLAPAGHDPKRTRPEAILTVSAGADSAFAAIDGYEKAIRTRDARWYVTDDRFTYKPGENVYVKGWVRWSHTGVDPDIALPAAGDAMTYTLVDAHGNKIATGTAPLTDQGGFDAEVALPKNTNLGTAMFTFTTNGAIHHHPISVFEFRTPTYAVDLDDDVTHGGAAPLILGESIEMSVAARYYAGGGLPGASIDWDAKLTAASYHPPGWNELSFEPPRPRGDRYARWREVDSHQTSTLSGASTAGIAIGISALPSHRPSVLSVDATVGDLDRTRIRASSRKIVVHPSSLYVGLRDRGAGVDVIVTDIDGNAAPGVPVRVEVAGVLASERYRNDAKPIDTQTCNLTSGAEPVVCAWTRRDLKTVYTATAHVADTRGRTNEAQLELPWWSTEAEQPNLAVVPDRRSYRPGDVAKLEIRSSVVPATAVVTFARQGVIAQKRVELAKSSTIVELPITAGYIENIHVIVDRWGKRQHQEASSTLPLPEHTAVQVNLPVDLDSARLSMKARPLKPLVGPGEQATFEVEVRHDGKPTPNAEVALMVVDEAVLALSHGTYADPLPAFYRRVTDGTSELSTLQLVTDAGAQLDGVPGFERFELTPDQGWGTIGEGGFGSLGSGSGYGGGFGSMSSIVTSRKDFRATAAFSPRLHTDEHGKVRLTVRMPDSLTRFRVVALATAEMRNFGKAESTIITQRKLNARAVAPRFLTQGDRFSLPVVVQNLDSSPRTVDVAVRAANLASIGERGRRVTIPPGQRAEVRFELATKTRGVAAIQTIATSGDFADATMVQIPIYEPATTESFATYGIVEDAPQFERLQVPAEIFGEVGGVEVELASTQLQSLTDAYWYLYAYPHECAEQRSARMLATTAMFDILEAFQAPDRPSRKTIEATRANDLAILTRDQRPDGGWGYFHGMGSDPYVTMQVLTALSAQKAKGTVVKNATAFVAKQANGLLAKLDKTAATPRALRKDTDTGYTVSLSAAALAALTAAGVDAKPRARRLHARALELDAYPLDAKARLLAIVARSAPDAEIRAKLKTGLVSAIHETAASASVTASYEPAERMLLVSQTKTSALALDALIRESPDQPLIAKLARGVLDARYHGRWRSTQENLVVLAAMRRYFDTYEKATPSYTGKLWFGTVYAEQAFAGHTHARATSHLDWSALAPGSSHDLALVKDGTGRMYYRVGITYAPKQTNLPALDAGFIVRRSYAAIDNPADVTRTKDGWQIRLGARVLVIVEALNTTKRYAVALVDPRPAGLEAVDENLAISERAATPADTTRWDFKSARDDRSEAFAMELAEGTHRFAYTARATTPGTFIAAPAKAEEMYAPETFGRSTGVTVVIE